MTVTAAILLQTTVISHDSKYMRIHAKDKKGFTLIELSIVLVIIGLIIGGILLGQSLIRQSQLNSAVTDFQRYTQATITFQQKYGALPGDFSVAQTYWGVGTTCSATYASPLASPLTCNGNGNGQIETNASTPAVNSDEALLFWQHLVSSQLITGSFNGSPGSGGTAEHTPGINCPQTRVDSAGFGVVWTGITSGDANYFDNNYGHVMILGGYKSNNLPVNPVISASEAYNIDSKFDDGFPGTGNILSWKSTGTYNTACTSSSTAYNISGSAYKCSLIFITGF